MRRFRLLFVLLAALVLLAGGACDDGESAGPEEGVTTEDVAEADDEELSGQQVTISGRIVEVVTDNVIRVGFVRGDNDDFGDVEFGVDEQNIGVLVILGSGVGQIDLALNRVVEVTGVVQSFDATALVDAAGVELDTVVLETEVEDEGDQAVLVATSISAAPEEE